MKNQQSVPLDIFFNEKKRVFDVNLWIATTCTAGWEWNYQVGTTFLLKCSSNHPDISANGSVRIFDLREKEHSTIIYESPQPDTPLLRLAWNKQDLRYMATILMDGNKVVILDIRSPTMPVVELERHKGSVNAISWAPQSCRIHRLWFRSFRLGQRLISCSGPPPCLIGLPSRFRTKCSSWKFEVRWPI